MRIIKESYQHLADYINSVMVDDQAQPELRLVDLWFSQVLDPELSDTLDFPAVFLEYSARDIESNGLWEQHVQYQVSVYLATVNYLDTYRGVGNQDTALAYLEMNAKLHDYLQGYRHPDVGTLNRIGFEGVQTPTNLIIFRQDYLATRMEIGPAETRRALLTAEDNDLTVEPGSVPNGGQQGGRFTIEL